AVVTVLGVIFALCAPLVERAREVARQEHCRSNLKELGFALLNHHTAHSSFPPLTSQGNPIGSANVWNTLPGATVAPNRGSDNGYLESPSKVAGYSWIARTLPYMRERALWNDVTASTAGLYYEAFSPV